MMKTFSSIRILGVVLLVCVCILCGVLTPVSANVPHAVRSSDGTFAVLFGSSGGEGSIKVFKNVSTDDNGDSKFKRSFEVRFSRIEETDGAGDRVQEAKDFADDPTMWQGPTATVVNGINTQLVSLTNNALKINKQTTSASLSISAYIYSSSGYVTQGGETLSVPKNSLKMTFGISNWPFSSLSNTLKFGVELMLDTKSSKDGGGKQTKIDSGRQRRMAWGGAVMDVAANAVIDGVLTPIQANLTSNGGKTFVLFTFPSFNSSMVYDPTVSIDDNTAAAGSLSIGNFNAAIISAIVIAAVANMKF